MRLLRRIKFVCLALVILAAWGRAQGNFHLKDGDRVVFYGDSITDQRLYTTFVETYVVTRFPHLNVRFVHSGWGGDRVTGGHGGPIDVRLGRDVFAYKPTVLTIMLGMNDGGVRPYDSGLFNTFATGYEQIIKSVKDARPGIRITVIQPSPYDDVTRPPLFEGGYNAVLIRYGAFVKELGQRERLTVADLNGPVVAVLEKAMAVNTETARKIIPDRVHPGPAGHLIMADALLKTWNAPASVTSVEIDAASRHVLRAENTTITGLKATSSVTWTQGDKALPMPLNLNDPVVALAVRCSDFVQSLDQQALKVTGLTATRYVLKIDGEEIGAFTKQQLEEGINLALSNTPMTKQAAAVHDLTLKHNLIHYARWRDIQVPFQDKSLPRVRAALDALAKLEADLLAKQSATAQPKPRLYELTAQ